ncbi:DDE superfamily endonuclease [Kribbella sp. VKM Ac-2527]|uniref:DDE superfamily endonuclease n=1 Tax=Kribbella caucasensis TaxID=2512215 RepID=A0A4R6KFN3_9ACTN|nr:DDE superfamily endonuclease [Kribbella sp. VKM Ac-2527]
MRPGREHDTTCARAHRALLPTLDAWTDDEHATLADLGYGGENRLTCLIKASRGDKLTDDQRTVNTVHSATRALAERGNSLLKTTFKALRRVSLCPWRIGAITAAALVLLHHQHERTT